MLVLTRKIGEKVVIGENIVVTLVGIERGKVRLGFEAPRDVPVFRSELLDARATDDANKPATKPAT